MNVEIAERFAKRRREAGYSQESLAEKLGVSRQAVSKWERSESSPDTDNLIALAQLYGVSLDDLLYVDESIKDDIAFEATDRAASGEDSSASEQTSPDSEEPVADSDSKTDKKKVKVGFSGIHVNDGDDYVHVSWRDGVHVKDAEQGDEVHVGWSGVHVKEGSKVRDRHIHKHGHKPKAWMMFPFPLLVILLYILLGVFLNAWALGLFVFFTIPVYYLLGAAISGREPAPFFAGIYPLATSAWFLYMAFVLHEPHPAWVIFLTIPIYEWIVFACARAAKRRKSKDDVIDVDFGTRTD